MAKKKAVRRMTIAMWTDEHRRCIVANKRADAAEAEVLRIRSVIDLAASEAEKRAEEKWRPRAEKAEQTVEWFKQNDASRRADIAELFKAIGPAWQALEGLRLSNFDE